MLREKHKRKKETQFINGLNYHEFNGYDYLIILDGKDTLWEGLASGPIVGAAFRDFRFWTAWTRR